MTNLLKKLSCWIVGCKMEPRNFLTESELKILFTINSDIERTFEYLKKKPYFKCSRCGREVR